MRRHEKRHLRTCHLLDQIQAVAAGGVFVRPPVHLLPATTVKKPVVTRKKVTRPDKPSAKRDGKTLELLRLSSEPLEPSTAGRPLVKKDGKPHLYSPTFRTSINPTPSHDHTPAPWPLITNRLRLIYLTRILVATPSHHFSMNLGWDLIEKALLDPNGFANHVQRLVARTLKRKLGRRVDFIFAVEVLNDAGEKRPHIQGILGISPAEVDTAADALKRVSGRHTLKFRQDRAIKIDLLWEPLGWATYVTKALWTLKADDEITGRGIACTNALIAPAKALYEADIAALKEAKAIAA